MTYEISCRDIGGDCDYVARGESAAAAKEALMQHAQREHADKLGSMTPEEMQMAERRMDEVLAKPVGGR